MAGILHLLAWQAAWFATVIAAAHGWSWAGPVVALPALVIAYRHGGRPAAWIGAGVLGLVVDGILVAAGAFHPAAAWGPLTLWMPCLWILLASALGLSLRWLTQLPTAARHAVGAGAGAAGGVAAYAGGFALGALTPGSLDRPAALGAIAAAWAVAMPALVGIHHRCARPA